MATEPVTNAASRKFARWGAEVFVGVVGLSALEFARRADLAWCGRHVVVDHWVHDDNVATIARNWRIAAVTVGIVTVVVVRPLLARWVERVGVRRALAAAGRIVAALVLALAVSEGALEYLRSKRPDPPTRFTPVAWKSTDASYIVSSSATWTLLVTRPVSMSKKRRNIHACSMVHTHISCPPSCTQAETGEPNREKAGLRSSSWPP